MDLESQRYGSRGISRYGKRAGLGLSAAGAIQLARDPSILKFFQSSKKRARDEDSERKNNKKKRMTKKNYGKAGMRNPRFTKSGTKKHRKTHKSKKVLVSKRQVKAWNKGAAMAKIDIATVHDFVRNVGVATVAKNKSGFVLCRGWDSLELEVSLAKAIFQQNSTSAATLNESNLITLGHQQKIPVSVGSSYTVVNNYSVPVWCDVYCFTPRRDNNKAVNTCFTEGLTDQNNVDSNSVFAFPSWSKQLMQLWKIEKHKRVCLQTGESLSIGYKKKFTYNPATADAVNTATPNRDSCGTHSYAVRLQGTLGHAHDTPFEAGHSEAAVDWQCDFHVKFQYDGGARMTNYYETYADSNQTNGTVVGCVSNAANTIFTKVD